MQTLLPNIPTWLLILLLVWVLPWKGYALWVSAQRRHTWWFIIIFLLNTLAILEIIYLFAVAKVQKKKPPKTEISESST